MCCENRIPFNEATESKAVAFLVRAGANIMFKVVVGKCCGLSKKPITSLRLRGKDLRQLEE